MAKRLTHDEKVGAVSQGLQDNYYGLSKEKLISVVTGVFSRKDPPQRLDDAIALVRKEIEAQGRAGGGTAYPQPKDEEIVSWITDVTRQEPRSNGDYTNEQREQLRAHATPDPHREQERALHEDGTFLTNSRAQRTGETLSGMRETYDSLRRHIGTQAFPEYETDDEMIETLARHFKWSDEDKQRIKRDALQGSR